jgi:hypothetical protein
MRRPPAPPKKFEVDLDIHQSLDQAVLKIEKFGIDLDVTIPKHGMAIFARPASSPSVKALHQPFSFRLAFKPSGHQTAPDILLDELAKHSVK